MSVSKEAVVRNGEMNGRGLLDGVRHGTSVSEYPTWTMQHPGLFDALSRLILLGRWLHLHCINKETRGKVNAICMQASEEKSSC